MLSWLLWPNTNSQVLQTLFTEDPKWGNVGDMRGMVCAHTTRVKEGDRSKLWLLSQKVKTGECGHWMKKKNMLQHANPLVPNQPQWAPHVGLLGVAMLAGPSLGAPSYMLAPEFEPLRVAMLEKGWDGRPLSSASYSLLSSKHAGHFPLHVNYMNTSTLKASTLHAPWPGQVGFSERVPKVQEVNEGSDSDSDEESDGMASKQAWERACEIDERAKVRQSMKQEMKQEMLTELREELKEELREELQGGSSGGKAGARASARVNARNGIDPSWVEPLE